MTDTMPFEGVDINMVHNNPPPRIRIGSRFLGEGNAEKAIIRHSRFKGGLVKAVKPTSEQHEYHCTKYKRQDQSGCQYMVRIEHAGTRIPICTKIIPVHTCRRKPEPSVEEIAAIIKDECKDLQKWMHVENVQARLSTRIRDKLVAEALEYIFHPPDKERTRAWRQIPDYLEHLHRSHPGAYTDWAKNASNVVAHTIIAPHWKCESVRQKRLRPVFAIDVNRTRKDCNILIAATLDANEQPFVLAVGTCLSGSAEDYKWFLKRLRKVYPYYFSPTGLLVTNGGLKVTEAVEAEVSEDRHVHLVSADGTTYGEQQWRQLHLAKLLDQMAFQREWLQLIQTHRPLSEALWEEGLPKWSTCHSPLPRFGMLTSNPCHSLNDCIEEHKNSPITMLLFQIQHREQMWKVIEWEREWDRRKNGTTHKFAPLMQERYDEAVVASAQCRVACMRHIHDPTTSKRTATQAVVQGPRPSAAESQEQFTVELHLSSNKAYCSCGEPQEAQTVCPHVIALCNHTEGPGGQPDQPTSALDPQM